MKTSQDNTLLSSVNPPRSISARSARCLDFGDGASRRHGVDDAKSHLADEDRSKYSRTPTHTTQRTRDIVPVQPKGGEVKRFFII